MKTRFFYISYKHSQSRSQYVERIFYYADKTLKSQSDELPLGTLLFQLTSLLPVVNSMPQLKTIDLFAPKEMNDVLKDFISMKKGKAFPVSITNNFMTFIETCCTDWKLCSVDNLSLFCAKIGFPLKCGNKLIFGTNIDSTNKILSNENIEDFLKNEISTHKKASFKKISTEKDILDFNIISTVYTLDSLADLISASLNEIFSQNLVIRKCKFCSRYFIPFYSRKDIGHCEEIHEEFSNRSCYELHSNQRKRYQEDKSESGKKHKSIRTRLARRVNEVDLTDKAEADKETQKRRQEHDEFMQLSKHWKQLMFNGTISEETYIQLMNDYYEKIKGFKSRKGGKSKL